MESQSNSFLEGIQTWFTSQEPVVLALLGGSVVLFLLFLVLFLRVLSRAKRLPTETPQLVLDAIQIAPLGRDAFIKIRNTGFDGVITGMKILGRQDVTIKNDVAGHELPAGKTYSLMFEAGSQQRLDKDFGLQLTYLDKQGNVYEQILQLGLPQQEPPKLVLRRKG